MWFPTVLKLSNSLLKLQIRLEATRVRVENIKIESAPFDSLLGPSPELDSLQSRSNKLVEIFAGVQNELKTGTVSVVVVNSRMAKAEALVKQQERFCEAFELGRAQAKLTVWN